MSENKSTHLRTIKSFVKRAGRVTERQQHALDNLKPMYGVETNKTIDINKLFANNGAIIVEVGFGMGQSLLTCAVNNPQHNYIGIEVHEAGVGALLADINVSQLSNLKVIHDDAVQVFKDNIVDDTLDGIQIFFPDPWHKKRHHKRRLIQTAFVELLVKKLKAGGFIHIATDWENYAEHILMVCNAIPHLINQSSQNTYVPRPASRPMTKYEKRGERLGHGVWDLVFYKK